MAIWTKIKAALGVVPHSAVVKKPAPREVIPSPENSPVAQLLAARAERPRYVIKTEAGSEE